MTVIYETERLTVREWASDDADLDRIFDIYSRWDVARWLGATPRTMQSRDEAPAMVTRWHDLFVSSGQRYGAWAVQVRETGTVAGTILFKLLPNSDGTPASDVEVGWHLHPDSWGHGYATEAASGAIERGFASGCPDVYAVVYPDNVASIAVCRRLGMTALGPTSRWYGLEVEGFVRHRDRMTA